MRYFECSLNPGCGNSEIQEYPPSGLGETRERGLPPSLPNSPPARDGLSPGTQARRSRSGGGIPPRSPARSFFSYWVVLRRGPASLRRLVCRCRPTQRSVCMLCSQLLFIEHLDYGRSGVEAPRGGESSLAEAALQPPRFRGMRPVPGVRMMVGQLLFIEYLHLH